MGGWSLWDWITGGSVLAAALLIAADGAIAQSEHLRLHFSRLLKGYVAFLPLGLLLLGSSAFAYQRFHPADVLGLPEGTKNGSPFGLIQAWGADKGAFYSVIKTSSIAEDRKLEKVILVVRVAFSDIDKMADKSLLKSQAYTILNGFMTLAIPMYNVTLRVLKDAPTPIEFNIVELPFQFSPSQITTLSDVEKLGGRILATAEVGAVFTTSPQAVCPPTPTRPSTPGKS